MEKDGSDVVPVGHEHGDVEVPQAAVLVDHELLHLGDLEASQLGLGGPDVELLSVHLVVDVTEPLTRVLHREHVTVITSEAVNSISQHVPEGGKYILTSQR